MDSNNKKITMANFITFWFPTIVGIMYFITSMAYLYKKDWAFNVVWFGYSLAQAGLVTIGTR